MKNEEIVRALRCISTAGGENVCEHCPYWKEEEVPEEERPIYGADTMHSCDVDRVGLDGAELIEKLTDRCARYAEEIAVLQEKTRWVPVTERLRELAEADRDGRLVVLPCKVGDIVWANLDGMRHTRKCVIEFANIGSHVTTIVFSTVDGLREQYGVNPISFGKTVFLTREEAERALEAMKGE